MQKKKIISTCLFLLAFLTSASATANDEECVKTATGNYSSSIGKIFLLCPNDGKLTLKRPYFQGNYPGGYARVSLKVTGVNASGNILIKTSKEGSTMDVALPTGDKNPAYCQYEDKSEKTCYFTYKINDNFNQINNYTIEISNTSHEPVKVQLSH